MIPAWFNRQNHPLVAATLVIPGMTLNDGGSVTFLLDTGAARTCLHPLDIFRLGIPIENFADNDSVRMDRVGGSAQYLETGAHVYFDQGLDGHGHRLLVAYAIDLLVAQPTDANRHYPPFWAETLSAGGASCTMPQIAVLSAMLSPLTTPLVIDSSLGSDY